jgi:hypothetical protein
MVDLQLCSCNPNGQCREEIFLTERRDVEGWTEDMNENQGPVCRDIPQSPSKRGVCRGQP